MRIQNVWGANKVYYGRCANGEWNLVPFVRSACYGGCEREVSDIKRNGKVSCFIICHSGKKTQSGIYNMTTLFPSSPSLHPCPKKKLTISYVSRSHFLSLVLSRLNPWPSAIYRYSMYRRHFFQIHSYHLITHVRK